MALYRGSSAIMAAGGMLLIAALSHHVREVAQVASQLGPAIALLLDGGLAISLIYAGWWLRHTDMTVSNERSVAIWTILGGLSGAGIASATLLVRFLEGRPFGEPQFSLLVHTGSGAVGLFIAGTYAARRQAVSDRFKTLFNNTIQFAGLLDPDGTVVEANEMALKFGGLDRSEVIGRQFHNISWWTHSEAVHERVQDAITRAADGETVRYDTEVLGVDGLRTIDFSARPITNTHGETTGIVVEGLDISNKKQQRQHLQVLHRVMRHNIRNDLTKLRGWTQVAATASMYEERIAAAEKIKGNLDTWEKMSIDIKEIQERTGFGRKEITDSPVETLLSDVIDSKRAAYPEAELELTQPEPPIGRIPPSIRKAIAEAIDNAIESNSTDTPTVSVTVERTDNGWVDICIADNGPGLPEQEAMVLETGEQTPLAHGKGLGVWKIRMLIKQVGGDISVNTDSEGTVLSLKLPDGSPD